MNKKTVTEGANNPFALGGTSPPPPTVSNQTNDLKFNISGTTNLLKIFENTIGENLLTKTELSEKLKFSVSYINKLMKQNKIPFFKNGRSVRFKYSDVVAALKKGSAV